MKGILRPEELVRGELVHVADVIGGAVASLDALVEVRRAVASHAVVLMDSGIRRGADVLKAMVLGADAVLVGRTYMYALAVGGEQGIETILRQLGAETQVTLALLGASSVRELDESWLAPS